MKGNFISDVTKIIIFAATIIVVCVLCAIGFKTANEGKSAVNAGTTQINSMASEYQDINKSIYDGATILGSELVNLINGVVQKNDVLAVHVLTLANSTGTPTWNYYNRKFDKGTKEIAVSPSPSPSTSVPMAKSEKAYINPTASFLGAVYKDKNSNIVCIEFTQQK